MTGDGNVRVAFINHGSGVQGNYSVSFSPHSESAYDDDVFPLWD